MENIKKFLMHICSSSYVSLLEKFNSVKYKNPVICKVWAEEDGLFYQTDRITERMIDDEGDRNIIMRKRIANNIILNRGLPDEKSGPYRVVLIPLPSFIKTLGLDDYLKFMKEWKGNSKIGSVEVIRYSVLV